MTDNELDEALDDAVRRFLLDSEGDHCPECSSPEIETRQHAGQVVLAYCPACEFTLEMDGASFIPYDRLPDPFRDRYDACGGHDTWNCLCPRCIQRRERHERHPRL